MTQGDGASPPSNRSGTSVLQLLAVIVLTLVTPLAIRFARGAAADERVPYLPALTGGRKEAFHAYRIRQLRQLNPGAVVIGDSMAGTRINERLLGQLSGVTVAPLLQAGSGSAFWYLALKNWVLASGIKPRVVFIFFRDTNLTDVMFRLDESFRWSLDMVAGDREEELDRIVRAAMSGPFYAAHNAAERTYGIEAARRSLEPLLSKAPARWVAGPGQADLLAQANERFGLDHMRVMEAADMAAGEDTDFHGAVGRSVLPLMLREARRGGFKLCLVRVQRRPVGGRPPVQSPALRRYISDLRVYLQQHGAVLHDDTGDPGLTLDMYEDGDHIASAARDRYTRLFYSRVRLLFRPAAPAAAQAPR